MSFHKLIDDFAKSSAGVCVKASKMSINKLAKDFAKSAAGVCARASKMSIRTWDSNKDFAEGSAGVCIVGTGAGTGVGICSSIVMSSLTWLVDTANISPLVIDPLTVVTIGAISFSVLEYASNAVNVCSKPLSFFTGFGMGFNTAAFFAANLLMPQAVPTHTVPTKMLEQPAPRPSQHPGSTPYRGATGVVKIIPKLPSGLRLSLV